jgi:DNA-binding CsgD family transcriptional regulator
MAARRGSAEVAVRSVAMLKSRPANGNGKDHNDLLEVLADAEPPAFATDDEQRIRFWNRGAEKFFGREPADTIGRTCYEVLRGRDFFGNRFCYRDCPIMATLRRGEPVTGCEFTVPATFSGPKTVAVTILPVRAARGESGTLVHILRPLGESALMARPSEAPTPAEPSTPRRGPSEIVSRPAPPVPPLTRREGEILGWVASGLQNKEVAQKLGISLATVRNHIHNILEKLQVHSKLEAVSLAFRQGWVSGDPELESEPDEEAAEPERSETRAVGV